MKNFLKLSAGQDIGLKNNFFGSARLWLTLFYTLIISVLIILLSALLYYIFAQDIREDIASLSTSSTQQINEIIARQNILIHTIFLIDGGIIIIVAAAGYFLAAKTLKPIQENYQTQKRFIADASHELRTPLAILKTDLQVALKKGVHTDNNSLLIEVNRIGQIVENLLLLSRLDSHQDSTDYSKINLVYLLKQCVNEIKAYAKHSGVTLSLKMMPAVTVFADQDKLRRAIFNILKNAVDYSYKEGRVRVVTQKNGNNIEISISDNGIGISEKDLKNISERFYRTENARKYKKEGNGLGLAIAKAILEECKGSIRVKSILNQGTTVILSLPF